MFFTLMDTFSRNFSSAVIDNPGKMEEFQFLWNYELFRERWSALSWGGWPPGWYCPYTLVKTLPEPLFGAFSSSCVNHQLCQAGTPAATQCQLFGMASIMHGKGLLRHWWKRYGERTKTLPLLLPRNRAVDELPAAVATLRKAGS